MAGIRRYARTSVLGTGEMYGTSYIVPIIRRNIQNGNIQFTEVVLQGSERLDTLAGRYYGDASLGWLIAAASNIGWMLQVPTGTRIVIPKLADVTKYTG
jgi:hypothetical protein